MESSAQVEELRAQVAKQADLVRTLKAECTTPKAEVDAAVAALKALKKQLDALEPAKEEAKHEFNRKIFEELMRRRFFYGQAFDIYGGVGGLYDYGPMGCALLQNVVGEWRSHFIMEENMLEVSCTMLTLEPVLKASGHVDRFTDLMVQDKVTKDYYRADHLLEGALEKVLEAKDTPADKREEARVAIAQVDGISGDQAALWAEMQKWQVKSPEGNETTEPVAFNLMFPTSIGPTGLVKGFLRPETAQGIFVNFKRLYEFNQRKMPFACAQIGSSFRNEISPRQGLLRVREFLMAEIEHFVNPERKAHPKFTNVKDLKLTLWKATDQEQARPTSVMTLGDAVAQGVVNNETIGYFIGRIYLFLRKIGIREERLRFRQHMCTEMAHYASDCWDAECLTSYGWVECVGCADRSAYDLTRHSEAAKVELVAQEDLPEPVIVDVVEALPVKQVIGKKYKKDGKVIMDGLAKMDKAAVEKMENDLKANGQVSVTFEGQTFELTPDCVTINRAKVKQSTITYTPGVIEPSFGIGRILYALLEQSFWTREGDEQRTVLSIPPIVAPLKVALLPISNSKELGPFISQIAEDLTEHDISYKIDDSSAALGRRYARTDELGTAFAVTVDFETVKNNTVTLREKDTMAQVRLPIAELSTVVRSLCRGRTSWADVESKYPKFVSQDV
eukprot:comp18137_c0_seq1/m.18868 comp18137_c0_seq1/g.18868  ORF comp18137_c0_seq1/g.18868 comp18137_c0_seq1/m.18868 type:complete len:675 (-) comp18137_c0_seq1:258-2282(-)